MKQLALLVLLAGLGSAGCAAMVGTSGSTYVPKDAASTCEAHCSDIGMALGSVVIMASTVGCVCTPPVPPGASEAPGAAGAAGGGMAALIIAEQQRRSSASRRR